MRTIGLTTEEFVAVPDNPKEDACLDCFFCKFEDCADHELVQKLNYIHGKCWLGNHHYELKSEVKP